MIEVRNINFSYNDLPVLKNISFDIAAKEKVVLLGVNGSGKSTLLKLINGLIPVRSGEIRYRNLKLTTSQLKNKRFRRMFRSEMAFLFQNPDVMIFNPTVYDEIAFGLRQLQKNQIDEKVKYWAQKVGVYSSLKRSPFQLSHGEKQKLCLASLLVIEPKVLLLDEPTSGLDPKSTGWLIELIHELESAVLIATHNLSIAAEMANRTIVLSEEHRLIYDGNSEQFLKNQRKLIKANLIHIHQHRHKSLLHTHYHLHENWD